VSRLSREQPPDQFGFGPAFEHQSSSRVLQQDEPCHVLEVFSPREWLENASLINRFNGDVHEFILRVGFYNGLRYCRIEIGFDCTTSKIENEP